MNNQELQSQFPDTQSELYQLQQLELKLRYESAIFGLAGLLGFLYLMLEFTREVPLIYTILPQKIEQALQENNAELAIYIIPTIFIVAMIGASSHKQELAKVIRTQIEALEKSDQAEEIVITEDERRAALRLANEKISHDPRKVWKKAYERKRTRARKNGSPFKR